MRTQGKMLWRGQHLRVVERTIRGTDGTTHRWECVDRPGVTDIVAVFPVTREHTTMLVEQYRAPLGRRILELAAGLCDVRGETLLHAAKRELREETGCIGGRLTELPFTAECSGLTNARLHVYIARGVRSTASRHLDDAEHASELHVIEFSVDVLEDALANYQRRTGNPVDLKIIAACAWWRRAFDPQASGLGGGR